MKLDDKTALFTLVMLLKNGNQRVMGWHRFIDAQQAFERVEHARAIICGETIVVHEPVSADEPLHPTTENMIVRLTDDFRQTFAIDVREIVSSGLSDNTEANELAALIQYHQARGQLAFKDHVMDDTELKVAMGQGVVQMPGNRGLQ